VVLAVVVLDRRHLRLLDSTERQTLEPVVVVVVTIAVTAETVVPELLFCGIPKITRLQFLAV
jgi:hypothetical protein